MKNSVGLALLALFSLACVPTQESQRSTSGKSSLEATSLSAGAGLLFESYFEAPTDLNQWSLETYNEKSATISSEVARSGKSSLKLVLNKSEVVSSGHLRAELKLHEGTLPLNAERWYGLSIYLPDSYKSDDVDESLFQMRSVPNRGESWDNVKPTPMFVGTKSGRYFFSHCVSSVPHDRNSDTNCQRYDLGPYETGKWADWVMHVKLSYKDDGIVELYRNGVRVFNHRGPSFYNDDEGPYFKIGIYKWGWNMPQYPSSTTQRILYYDNIRIADERGSVEAVSSSGTSPSEPPSSSAVCADMGSIKLEKWEGISGNSISDIPLSKAASSVSSLSTLEFQNLGEDYGTRISGYICPPVSGNYTFYISGDDETKLSLSSSDQPSGLAQIAGFSGWTLFRDLAKYSTQKSKVIALAAGKKYFLEVLQKEGNGGDHLSVGWDMPDGKREFPLPSSRLSQKNTVVAPPAAPVTCSGTGSITHEKWDGISGTSIADIPLSKTASTIKTLSNLEINNLGDEYGTRISGFVCPPVSGNYTFLISGDDDTKLSISSSESPSGLSQIAGFSGWTQLRDLTKYASQKSKSIALEAGKKYFIEVLHKEGGGGDHVTVGWDMPDGKREFPLPGNRLAPKNAPSAPAPTPVPTPSPAACIDMGSIKLEKWEGISGTSIANIPLTKTASSASTLSNLEFQNLGDNYGTRISGYICPPVSGSYTFYISGDDDTKLSLSSSDQPSGLAQIAGFSGWTAFRDLAKYSSQKSKTISLEAGKKYLIEVLHKEGGGGDHLSVGWDMPDGKREFPLPASRLSLKNTVAAPVSVSCSGTGSITHEMWSGIAGTRIADIPLSKTASSVKNLSSLEISNLGDEYGTRISGFVCPPVSGNYTFLISGDDDTKLSISSSESPSGLSQIAGFSGWTQLRDLSEYASQKSKPIALEAGKKYFIEVLHKEGGGGDHVTVGWDMPDGKREFPLPGNRLAPKTAASAPVPAPVPAPAPTPVTCSSDGKISLERMTNFNSHHPEDLENMKANVIEERTLFEAPTNIADNYGTRMSGYICVPASGDYTFYIAGDDQVALYLSTDESVNNRRKIAYHDVYTNPREYNKYATQTSAPIKLVAGKKYYIEALQVEQNGGDNLSVGWKLPDGTLERPIPGHRLSVNSAVKGETTPTPTPAPKAGAGSTVSVDDSFNPSSVTYAAPLVITKGGTYSGNWESKKSGIAAVTIKTNEPVIIENSVIRGAGILISAVSGATNLEVRNSRGYGLAPTSDLFNDGNGNTYRAPRRFLSTSTFKRVILENNYLENTAGISISDGYVGTTGTDTIKIRYNKIKNIDGRVYQNVILANFVGLNYKSNSIPNVEIAWNQVVNEPGNSRVEDNINIYNSRGTPESPIRIHNNYIQGAYGLPGEPQKFYSGGGILTDCPEVGPDKATAYLKAYENQVINSLNYGMGIAGGNNIHYYNNRVVNSGFLPDGRNMNEFYPNAWPSGYFGVDYYHKNSTFNNLMENNVVGVKSWESRKDLYFPESQEIVAHKGWIILPDPITLDVQKNEWNIWADKVKAKGIKVGPQ